MKHFVLSLFAACMFMFGGVPPAQAGPVGAATASAAEVRPGVRGGVRVVVDDPALKTSGGDQPVGPQTFAVDSGRVYVHDGARAALRIYTLTGVFVRSVALPQSLAVADLAVRGSVVDVLDIDGGVHTLSLAGSSAVETAYSEPEGASGVGVSQIAWFGDQLVGHVADVGESVLSKGGFLGKPMGALIGDGAVSVSGETVEAAGSAGVVAKRITLPDTPIDAHLAYREPGASYEAVTGESQSGDAWLQATWLFRYDDAGLLVASYSLGAQSWYTPFREFAVSDGHVYQLLIGASHAQVVEVSADRAGTAVAAKAVTKLAVPLKAALPPAKIVAKVLARATSMNAVTWTFVKAKHGHKFVCVKPKAGHARKSRKAMSAAELTCDDQGKGLVPSWIVPSTLSWRVVQAPQLAAIAAAKATVAAFPYAWGGYDTDNTHSEGASWKNFTKSLKAKKVFVSNVKGPRGTTWVPNTSGVDCSGFISSVFGLGAKRGTGNLVDGESFATIGKRGKVGYGDPGDAQAGDILNHEGHHVALVLNWVDADDVQVAESTTTTKYGQVAINTYPIAYYQEKGFVAARYRHWVKAPHYCGSSSEHPMCLLSTGHKAAK